MLCLPTVQALKTSQKRRTWQYLFNNDKLFTQQTIQVLLIDFSPLSPKTLKVIYFSAFTHETRNGKDLLGKADVKNEKKNSQIIEWNFIYIDASTQTLYLMRKIELFSSKFNLKYFQTDTRLSRLGQRFDQWRRTELAGQFNRTRQWNS